MIARLESGQIESAYRLMKARMNGHCPELTQLTQAVRCPNTEILIAESNHDITGAILAGHVTARAKIADIAVELGAAAESLVMEVIKRFAARGIYRVHALVHAGEIAKIEFFQNLGFAIQPGEVTMMRSLSDTEYFLRDDRIDEMRTSDIMQALAILAAEPEVALCCWENEEFLRAHIGQPNSALYVSRDGDRVTGVLIGGNFLSYSSICHVAVAKDCKGQGIGRKLSERALSDFARRGAKKNYLMVTAGNLPVLHFWEKFGYSSVNQEVTTLEYDIPFRATTAQAV